MLLNGFSPFCILSFLIMSFTCFQHFSQYHIIQVLFRMNGIAHAYEPLSSGFDAEKIRNELNQLGDDLNCDIDLIDADDGGDGN